MSTSPRVLFVSNGHGEVAIAARIAQALPAHIQADHLALVGGAHNAHDPRLRDVGPRRALPSGGLIAMGNMRNIARDLGAGLLAHTLSQLRFLRGVRGTYDVGVAVGDVFALLMTLRAQARSTIFAGTAKSVFVAPYGALEERALARADAVFVRDDPTVEHLRSHGIAAQAANVIVDLYSGPQEALHVSAQPELALFPGSREAAYADAVRLARLVRALLASYPAIGAALSIAPGLDPQRMAAALAADGWSVEPSADVRRPFALHAQGRLVVQAWTGPIAALLEGSALVLGQAGTANEAAAAAKIPVVAYERGDRPAWYRRRQMGLLGGALLVVRGAETQAAGEIAQLLADPQRRAKMGEEGCIRMGRAGGAERIAAAIAERCE